MAPFDKSLWINVGMMQAQEGQIALARLSLEPIANDTHGCGPAQAARTLITLLEAAPEGTPLDLAKPGSIANVIARQKSGGVSPAPEPID